MQIISITMNTYQVINDDEIIPSLLASDSHRGGGIAIVISELGRHGCIPDADTEQCERSAENAGQR